MMGVRLVLAFYTFALRSGKNDYVSRCSHWRIPPNERRNPFGLHCHCVEAAPGGGVGSQQLELLGHWHAAARLIAHPVFAQGEFVTQDRRAFDYVSESATGLGRR